MVLNKGISPRSSWIIADFLEGVEVAIKVAYQGVAAEGSVSVSDTFPEDDLKRW